MLKNLFAASLIAAVPAFAANADEAPIQFNGVELGYLSADADNGDGDGFSFKAEYGFLNHYFGTVSYNTRTLEFDSGEVDIEQANIGVGGKYALSESGKYVVFGGLTYEMLELDGQSATTTTTDPDTDTGGTTGTPLDVLLDPLCALLGCPTAAQTKAFGADGTGDSGGYGAHAGIRAEVYPNVEVGATYQYRMYDDELPSGDDTETVVGLNAGYRFGSWAAVLSYNTYDTLNFDEYGLAVRWEFGRE